MEVIMVTILKSLTGKNKDGQHGRTKHGNRGMGFLNQRAELGDQGSRGRQCSETEAGGQAGSLFKGHLPADARTSVPGTSTEKSLAGPSPIEGKLSTVTVGYPGQGR